ncbi:oligosaccharide flippase family protein [Ramlibacter sp.]|uniref:oligosaccharide flippase family protein n=1 Tax=Ramlibacter sp. TaxID=1917967 RepID=UPI0035B34D12
MSLHRNVVANGLGQGWVALMSVAFVPLYIRLLGIEAYGLIGVFAAIQAWLTLLDVGLALALNREMARHQAGLSDPAAIRDVVRSVEVLCAALASVAMILLASAAPWLSESWLRPGALAIDEVRTGLYLMAFIVGCRLLEGVYHGAVQGLQRQVAASAASAALATFRWGGAALVLLAAPPTVGLFFAWQALASVLGVVVFAALLYRHLPAAPRPARASPAALKGMGPFAAGVAVTTLLGLLLTQLDKVILSRQLDLGAFGHYALAAYLASALQQLVLPISQAYYPRLSQLVAQADAAGEVRTYHEGAQLVTVLITPAAFLLILFGEAGLRLWTGDAALAGAVAPMLAFLAAGSLFNGFMSLPYNLQLAHGWSQFAVRVNLIAVALYVPALLWVVPHHAALGAAWLWLALNAGYFLVGIHFMHRRLLPAEKWAWYAADVAGPAAAAALVMVPAAWCLQPSWPPAAQLAWLGASGVAGLLAAAAGAPAWRTRLARRRR